MKGFFVIVLIAIALTVVSSRPDDKYSTKFDNVDLDEIIQNQRLLKNYVNCLLDKGNCSPDGQELKSKFIVSSLFNICWKIKLFSYQMIDAILFSKLIYE